MIATSQLDRVENVFPALILPAPAAVFGPKCSGTLGQFQSLPVALRHGASREMPRYRRFPAGPAAEAPQAWVGYPRG